MDARQACMVRPWNQCKGERKLTSGLIHLNLPAIVAQFPLLHPATVPNLCCPPSALRSVSDVHRPTKCPARQQTLCDQGSALSCIGLSQAELAKQLLIAPANIDEQESLAEDRETAPHANDVDIER